MPISDDVMEIYFSTDIESDGPIPGPHSMLSFGVAAFEAGNPSPLGTFEANLELLPDAQPHPDTMAWWNALEQKAAWETCRKNLQNPEQAIKNFVKWVDETCATRSKTSPVFVAYPAGYDFTFMYWYMLKFAKRSPFSFSALDIKSFAMGALGANFRETTKRNMPRRWFDESPHTHVALDDAIEQGRLFLNILEDVEKFTAKRQA
jgi:hypothetical protein